MTTPLTTEQLDELERLCEAATDGPWFGNVPTLQNDGIIFEIRQEAGDHILAEIDDLTNNDEANSEFIAAANPATITALLAEVRQMREEWEPIATLPDTDDLVWLLDETTTSINGPRPPRNVTDPDEYTHWALAEPPPLPHRR